MIVRRIQKPNGQKNDQIYFFLIMFNDDNSHRILLIGISASLSFTVFVAGIIFGELGHINDDVDVLLTDVGYIRGVIDSWDEGYIP
jgi:hypothetical protein